MRLCRISFAWVAGLLLAPLAFAQVPAGDPFLVNAYTTGIQQRPSVASLPNGPFVVVWESAGESAIAGQIVESSGDFRGAEFQVAPAGQQGYYPEVAADQRGRFVVTWVVPEASGTYRVTARRFDPSGAPLGGALAVGTATATGPVRAKVAMQRGGAFVAVWTSTAVDGSEHGTFGQRVDGSGQPVGGRFQANTYTTGRQHSPAVAADESGGFVVVWTSVGQDGSDAGVFGQRFQADGTRSGLEFRVNAYTTNGQSDADVVSGAGGEFVVTWRSLSTGDDAFWSRRFDGSGTPLGPEVRAPGLLPGFGQVFNDAAASAAGDFVMVWDLRLLPPNGCCRVMGQRFKPTGEARGQEFVIDSVFGGASDFPMSRVASDESGNLLATWQTPDSDVYARRYGGLLPAGLAVDDGGNGVLEVADTFTLETSWRNVNGADQTFSGQAASVSAPAGLTLTLSAGASYGTVPDGATGACNPCFTGSLTGARPAGHVDASLLERILPDAMGQTRRWALHVGDSFTDVPRASPFYRFVETLLHHQVTAGCSANAYCPALSVTREQMAPFVLVAKEGAGYAPPACATPMFADVPASSPFCRWIEELARRGVTAGCGPGLYCPTAAVSREQMAVFVLRTLDPNLDPPACTTPIFSDVPADSPFCRWIEELVRRGVVSGCAAGRYCPADPVTREQMAVFLTGTFGLTLYGP